MKMNLVLLFMLMSTLGFGQDAIRTSKVDAERVWNLAITAKGGREKLHAIKNVQISISGEFKKEFLIVYPSKLWQWEDRRPTVFGLIMSMYNLETGKKYFAQQGQKSVRLESIESNDSTSRTFSALSWLLLENEWIRPVPESVITGTVNGQKVDIVRTTLNGSRVDFAFDRSTHLLVRATNYISSSKRGVERIGYEVYLQGYKRQDGIMIPTEVNSDTYSYHFNIGFNPQIFVTAPLPVEAAADAWKRRD